jgi:hypothetical protein
MSRFSFVPVIFLTIVYGCALWQWISVAIYALVLQLLFLIPPQHFHPGLRNQGSMLWVLADIVRQNLFLFAEWPGRWKPVELGTDCHD